MSKVSVALWQDGDCEFYTEGETTEECFREIYEVCAEDINYYLNRLGLDTDSMTYRMRVEKWWHNDNQSIFIKGEEL